MLWVDGALQAHVPHSVLEPAVSRVQLGALVLKRTQARHMPELRGARACSKGGALCAGTRGKGKAFWDMDNLVLGHNDLEPVDAATCLEPRIEKVPEGVRLLKSM